MDCIPLLSITGRELCQVQLGRYSVGLDGTEMQGEQRRSLLLGLKPLPLGFSNFATGHPNAQLGECRLRGCHRAGPLVQYHLRQRDLLCLLPSIQSQASPWSCDPRKKPIKT